MTRLGVVTCAALLAACGPSATAGDGDGAGSGGGIDSGPGGGGPNEFADAAPSASCERMDILFVIDDSISMAQEQSNLVANFPGFIQVLDDYRVDGDRLLDYRVAVTTTGRTYDKFLRTSGQDFPNGSATGADGALAMDCGMMRPWLERTDPDVPGTFSCIAEVGIGGPTDEMPLACTELALSDRIADGTNAGFLREDALLAIVVLTDEDDCSTTGETFTTDANVPPAPDGACTPGRPVELTDVGDTISFLDELKGNPGRWALAAIAGPGPETCSSSFGDAIPAHRLLDLVDRKQPRASFSSLCQGDLTGALADALATFDEACQSFPPID